MNAKLTELNNDTIRWKAVFSDLTVIWLPFGMDHKVHCHKERWQLDGHSY